MTAYGLSRRRPLRETYEKATTKSFFYLFIYFFFFLTTHVSKVHIYNVFRLFQLDHHGTP